MQGHLESHRGPHHEHKEHKHEHKEHKHEHKHHHENDGEAHVNEHGKHHGDHHMHFIQFITHPFAHPVVTIVAIIAAFAAFKVAGVCPFHLIKLAYNHFHDASFPVMIMNQIQYMIELAAQPLEMASANRPQYVPINGLFWEGLDRLTLEL